MKTCSDCREEKPLDEFGAHSGTGDGKNWYCRECANARSRRNHAARGAPYRNVKAEKQRERARKAKSFIVQSVFGGYCYDCGESYPDCVFDFHHEGEKEGNPSQFISRNKMEEALDELEKCVMLCANCHRMRHFHNKE